LGGSKGHNNKDNKYAAVRAGAASEGSVKYRNKHATQHVARESEDGSRLKVKAMVQLLLTAKGKIRLGANKRGGWRSNFSFRRLCLAFSNKFNSMSPQSVAQWPPRTPPTHMLRHCPAKVEPSSMCDPFKLHSFGFHWLSGEANFSRCMQIEKRKPETEQSRAEGQ